MERFDDIINAKESKFYPFSVGSSGTTTINLASLSPVDRPGVITATLEIGWGKAVKDDDGNVVGCNLAKVLQAAPALTAQLTDTLTPAADYCANLADVGGLREAGEFLNSDFASMSVAMFAGTKTSRSVLSCLRGS